MNEEQPCYNCAERHYKCHSDCPRHAKALQIRAEKKAAQDNFYKYYYEKDAARYKRTKKLLKTWH